MKDLVPRNRYRTTPEGFVDVLSKPRTSLRRKIGIAVAAAFMLPGAAIQADVVYSQATTVQTSPDIHPAEGSIPCENVKAVIFVDPGFGIQNAQYTAAKVASLANEYNMCTQYVTYGTTADIDVIADKKAEILRESREDAEAINPSLKPNAIDIGESLGGIVAMQTRNKMIEKTGDEFSYPAILADATPIGGEALRWGNPTIAEAVARNCRVLKVGDFVMTLVSVLTDPNEARKSQLWDDRRDDFFWQVYKETKESSMQLRIHEACIAGEGVPYLDQEKQQTFVLYAYTSGDPIVDGTLSKDGIKERAKGYFEEIHMQGNGIDGHHAAAMDEWELYEPYYANAFRRMNRIIVERELSMTWHQRAPYIPQPR